MARYQKLSDELIVPNLGQDISFFYDPATKKLRKQFEIYPEALQETVNLLMSLNERTPNCSNKSKPNANEAINMRSYTVILSGREESRIISEQFSTQIKSEMFASLNMTRPLKR